jgi:hypothetical protein
LEVLDVCRERRHRCEVTSRLADAL